MEYHYAFTGTHRVRDFCICTILSGGSPFKGPVSPSHDLAHPGGWFASWHSLTLNLCYQAQNQPFSKGPVYQHLGMVLEVKVWGQRVLIARGVTVETLDFNKQSQKITIKNNFILILPNSVLKYSFLGVKFTYHKILSSKGYNLVVCRIFTELCKYHHDLIPECFYYCKKKPCARPAWLSG